MRTLAVCFDLPENLAVTAVHPTELTLTIDLACSDPTACCPLCRQPSERVHSKYSRLTTHAIIDLLPDREAETAAAWMRLHPEIEIVSRDRGEDYASAARLGAPQARQVADRFHLAKNLTEIVEEILARCRAEIRKTSKPADDASAPQGEENAEQPLVPQSSDWAPNPPAGSAHLAHHAERLDRYQQLIELRNEGLTTKEIARRLDMAERTVRHWLKQGIPYANPESRCKEGKRIDPYMAYVTERWNRGEHNGLTIFRELQTQGYKGSPRSVYRFLEILRGYPASSQGRAIHAQTLPEAPLQRFAAHEAVWLFVREHSDLDETEQAELAAIRQVSCTANTVYELTQEFMQMLRHRRGEQLDTWLENVRTSQVQELQRMVRSIERDKAAVLAGLTLTHSNGIVEGSVNKLKYLKRMGFGRAGFALLRQRVLHALQTRDVSSPTFLEPLCCL